MSGREGQSRKRVEPILPEAAIYTVADIAYAIRKPKHVIRNDLARDLLYPSRKIRGKLYFSRQEVFRYLEYRKRIREGVMQRLSRSVQRTTALRSLAKASKLFGVTEPYLSRLIANWRGK